MDEEKAKELESKAIDLMRFIASERNLFQLREGDGRLASIDRLVPDFYALFTNSVRLAYMKQWGTFESVIIVVPMAILLLVTLISFASQVAQIALDILVSVTVSCSHIWQHGIHLSQASSGPCEDYGGYDNTLPALQFLRWVDDKSVANAWGGMHLPRPDNRTERLRQLASSLKRLREERMALQQRRSVLKEGPPDHHLAI